MYTSVSPLFLLAYICVQGKSLGSFVKQGNFSPLIPFDSNPIHS